MLPLAPLLDAYPDALLVVDPAGRILRANAQVEALFGHAEADVVGREVELLLPERLRARHRAHRERYAADARMRPMGAGLDLRGLRRDGTEFPVDILLSPLETELGPAVLCVVRDVSERWKAEQRFRALLESAPDAMVIVDEAGLIRLVNSQTERLFGFPRAELLDQPVEKLIPERYRALHPALRAGYFADPAFRPMGAGLELHGIRKDGTEFPVEISLSPLDTEEGVLVSSAIRDLSERKQHERVLCSLREKEVLLKEIHHRVKNNLAVISSMLYLQSTLTDDERATRVLRENQERVRCMALVHESLYRSEDFASIDFAAYAESLARMLIQTYAPDDGRVQLQTDLESVDMSIEVAIPCGLILNELLTNALLHAFPPGSDGEIVVALRADGDDRCMLSVTDTGVGLPADDERESPTLGLRLIRALCGQLAGSFELRNLEPGTDARLTFAAGGVR